MSSDKKIKKDKEIFFELELRIKELKHQLNDQLRCLDQRLESQVCMSWELQDFFQRRAEVELEYAKNLEKLVKQTMARHKAEKQKREQWQGYSAYKMWHTLLGITLKQSKNRTVLAETYNTAIAGKFTQLMEDMQRIYKKCRDMTIVMHNELTKAVTELHSSMKTYHIYHIESQQAELKLEKAEREKNRVEQDSKKGAHSRRFKNFEKQLDKNKTKFEESDLKSRKARNDHLLCLDAANASIRKFFVDDLPELINVMDYSYHVSLGQIMMYIVELEETINQIQSESLVLLSHKAKDLNQRSDRQVFLQQFHQIFSLPKKFEFQPHRGDQICEVTATALVREELADRLKTITDRLHKLKLEDDEIWKTLETTDTALLEKRTVRDIDIVSLFRNDKEDISPLPQQQAKTLGDIDKQTKLERIETEDFYLSKFKQHQLNSNLMARLQAKCAQIEMALGSTKNPSAGQSDSTPKRPLSLAFRQTKKRHLGKSSLISQPKLFGGSIEEYVQATGQEIPAIVKCCIRIINLYGMHHQGVFRVPGSQHEINDFKDMFERGEEPVLSNVDSRDINSIAGVLKLYFRELREPLFPLQLYDELIACPSKYNVSDMTDLKKCISRIQELLLPLPRPIFVVMRYLVAFLNHFSEYSDENMMDAHNLAVCFGPTLMPIQSDQDQMRCQNYVNELIRILIVHQEAIFPKDGGLIYEKCIVEDDGEDSLDSMLEDIVGEGSEEDIDYLEAVAVYDFSGHSSRELSFRKGDVLLLMARMSPEWWEGSFNNKTGLIPHKYIALQGRANLDKDNNDLDERMKMSTESLPTKPYSAVSPHLSTSEPLDRSFSQPNICGGPVSVSSTALDSFLLTSSDLSAGGYASCSDSLQSFSSKDVVSAEAESKTLPGCSGKITADEQNERSMPVSSDVMSGLSLLEMEPTPDLVLNLPFNISEDLSEKTPSHPLPLEADDLSNAVPSSSPSNNEASGLPMTNADLFALAGQGTIKKGMTYGSQQSVGLPSPMFDHSNLKPGVSPDSACTDEMLNSTLEEIEQTLSGLVVSTSLKLFGINPKVQSPSSALNTPPSLFPSASLSQTSAPSGYSSCTSTKAESAASSPNAIRSEELTSALGQNSVLAEKSKVGNESMVKLEPLSLTCEPVPSTSAQLTNTMVMPKSSLKQDEANYDVKVSKPSGDDKPRPKPPPTLKKPLAISKEKP